MRARSAPGQRGRRPGPGRDSGTGDRREFGPGAAGAQRGRGARVLLYRMDARRAVAALPARVVDVVITDPPYRTVARSGVGGHLRDWFRGGLSWRDIGGVLAACRRRLAPDGVAFVMTNGAGLREALEALDRAGFERVRVITWDRRSPGLGAGLRHQTEYVLVGQLPGSRTLAGSDLVSVAAVGPGTADRYPTEKPEGLGRALARIATVRPGELVLDPFCGSGALLVGALERGASVIGIDTSARATRRASERLGAASRRPSASPARPAGRDTSRRRP